MCTCMAEVLSTICWQVCIIQSESGRASEKEKVSKKETKRNKKITQRERKL